MFQTLNRQNGGQTVCSLYKCMGRPREQILQPCMGRSREKCPLKQLMPKLNLKPLWPPDKVCFFGVGAPHQVRLVSPGSGDWAKPRWVEFAKEVRQGAARFWIGRGILARVCSRQAQLFTRVGLQW